MTTFKVNIEYSNGNAASHDLSREDFARHWGGLRDSLLYTKRIRRLTIERASRTEALPVDGGVVWKC